MADTFWSFELVKGGSFAAQLLFETGVPEAVDLSNADSIRMLVKFGASQLEWSTATSEITILSPPTDGLIRISLTRVAIEALPFKLANYYLFIDEGNDSSLVLEGTITVK